MTIIKLKLVDRSIMPLAGPQLILIARNVVAAAFERFDRFAFDGDDIKGSKAHNFAARRGGAPILQVSENDVIFCNPMHWIAKNDIVFAYKSVPIIVAVNRKVLLR
jgi:hypothetical protein